MTTAIRSKACYAAVCAMAVCTCQKPNGSSATEDLPATAGSTEAAPAPPATADADTPPPKPVGPPPKHVEVDLQWRDSDRWLEVERIEPDADGGWATALFEVDRNKLVIRTQHVRAFAIDVSRVPIRWEELVILNINGRSSELRQRDFSPYHVAKDEHGQWVVVEPS